MTREIKFRAWDKKQKKMLYGVSIGTIKVWDENAPFISHEFSYSKDCIFEQYTGLKDKNGKEIYEGDIVKIWSGERSELSLGGSQYHLEHYPYTREVKIDSRGVYIEYPGYMLLRNFADLEVIGNIHENPELLEKGE